MGFIAHHAIIVTGESREEIEGAAVLAALDLGCQVLGPIISPVNAYLSFVVPPDGSKEGWSDSDKGNDRRLALKAHLKNTSLSWVEVRYSPDDQTATVVEHGDQ